LRRPQPCRHCDKTKIRKPIALVSSGGFIASEQAELVTGDPEFTSLEKEIKIAWLK
jgi:hypothetical protein